MDSVAQKGNNIGAVVFDFDSTITTVDVCDTIMGAFSTNWRDFGTLHDEGDISHLELNRRFLSSLNASPEEVSYFLRSQSFLRHGFLDLIADLQENNIPFYIISGGWDFYIKQILEEDAKLGNLKFSKGLPNNTDNAINVICNKVYFQNGVWSIEPPESKTFLSSPDKVKIIEEIRKRTPGQIVYFGDGSTDIEAAEKVDIVFARGSLAKHCASSGKSHVTFEDFEGINTRHLERLASRSEYPLLLDFLKANFFFDPTGKNYKRLGEDVAHLLKRLTEAQGDGPYFQSFEERLSTNEIIANANLSEDTTTNTRAFLKAAVPMGLQYGVRAGHPMMVKNIIPTPATIFLTTQLAASIYAQNGVTGEDAGEALNSELKVAAVISDMAHYDRTKSAGVFTFGGTGTNMYGIKVGLAKCCPDGNIKGLRKDICVVGSMPAHYSHVTATDWLGIGQKNYLHVKSNLDQTTDLSELDLTCRQAIESGKTIACIIGVAGTTSNMAIDDFENIKRIRDRLVHDYQLSYTPHIHADSVVGWPYLYFSDYDFNANKLGFSESALKNIKNAAERISTIRHADSFGVDFHKTGYMPYNSSMFVCKEKEGLLALGRNANLMTPLFHEENTYNPGKVTLETSRSSATMLSTWLTMQALGKNGYRVLLGHAQEMANVVRSEIRKHKGSGLYIANANGYGTDVFVRCYLPSTMPEEEFEAELADPAALKENSDYTSEFFKCISKKDNVYGSKIALSKTSAAFYTPYGQPYVALRLYMLSPFTTEQSAKQLVETIVKAKAEFDKTLQQTVALSPESTSSRIEPDVS